MFCSNIYLYFGILRYRLMIKDFADDKINLRRKMNYVGSIFSL